LYRYSLANVYGYVPVGKHPDAINVILDPGLAFGTGTSPTTALCLEWLEANIKPGMNVIDYGCGSGILALAALKLGARQVIAVDYDEQAITATQDNGARNDLLPPRLTVVTPTNLFAEPVDLVVANILTKSLIELAPILASLVKPQGKILLSGILVAQAVEVITAYQPWFKIKEQSSKNEWVRLAGEKIK
jgi:ribosomal protein L11 methyltransferase